MGLTSGKQCGRFGSQCIIPPGQHPCCLARRGVRTVSRGREFSGLEATPDSPISCDGLALVSRDHGARHRVGSSGRSARADRYAYIPLIGIFVIVVSGYSDWADSKQIGLGWRMATATIILAALSFLTARR